MQHYYTEIRKSLNQILQYLTSRLGFFSGDNMARVFTCSISYNAAGTINKQTSRGNFETNQLGLGKKLRSFNTNMSLDKSN
jgi:hypothetical protein